MSKNSSIKSPLLEDFPSASENGELSKASCVTEFRRDWKRHLVLFNFSVTACVQCIVWLTFSPVSFQTMAHYNISADSVNLLLNWGAIFSWPGIPLTMILAKQKGGLRVCVLVATCLTFSCTVLRLIPEWFPSAFMEMKGGSNAAGMFLVNLGHMLVALAGPLVMSTPAQVERERELELAQTWYGDSERATATAIGSVANNFGVALGFLIGPAVVAMDPDRIPNLLYCHFGLSAFCMVAVFGYFPARPKDPPSLAAFLQNDSERKQEDYAQKKANRLKMFLEEQERASVNVTRIPKTDSKSLTINTPNNSTASLSSFSSSTTDVPSLPFLSPGTVTFQTDAGKPAFNPYAMLDLPAEATVRKDTSSSSSSSSSTTTTTYPALTASSRHYSGAFNPYTALMLFPRPSAAVTNDQELDPVPDFNVLDVRLEDMGQTFLKSLWEAAKHGQFMMLAFAGGVTIGSFNAWSGLLDLICHPLRLTPDQSGYLGFAVTIASIVGGLCVVQLAEKYFFRRFKRIIVILMFFVLLSFIWFTMSIPLSTNDDDPIIPFVFMLLLLCISIAGFFQGAAQPLFCELAVELTYPLSETTSVGMIGLWGNVAASIVLGLPAAQSHWLNVIMCAIIGISLLTILCVKEQYKRLDAGQAPSEPPNSE